MFMLSSLFSKPVESGENNPLTKRMKTTVKKCNDYSFHPYKCHILTLKSKELLRYVNGIEPLFDKRLMKLGEYNKMLLKVCMDIYNKMDPTFIFAFNNEINVIFYYSEYDKDSFVYNGNINKTITKMSSYASLAFYKELNMDVLFTCEQTEFDLDYECLNYIIWRQNECFRNNASMLYRVLNGSSENIDLDTICYELCKHSNIDASILYGNVIKKEIVYKVSNDDIVTRKKFDVSSVALKDNFKENLHKYVFNKLL